MSRPKADLTGKTFNHGLGPVAYISDVPPPSGRNRHSQWRCFCGIIFVASTSSVVIGLRKSCGCESQSGGRPPTHGMTGKPVFNAWLYMMVRALHTPGYFSGPGPAIDPRYVPDQGGCFENFLADTGSTYYEGASLDRKDNLVGYFKDNLRWIDLPDQQRNKTNNKVVTLDGITAPVAEHCDRLGIPTGRTYERLKAGWSVEEAFDRSSRIAQKIGLDGVEDTIPNHAVRRGVEPRQVYRNLRNGASIDDAFKKPRAYHRQTIQPDGFH